MTDTRAKRARTVPARSNTPSSSPTEAASATKRVPAMPRPRSASESHPVVVEKVCSSDHVPKAEGPSPLSSSGSVMIMSPIVQRFPTPVATVLMRSRCRNGWAGATGSVTVLSSAETGIDPLPVSLTAVTGRPIGE